MGCRAFEREGRPALKVETYVKSYDRYVDEDGALEIEGGRAMGVDVVDLSHPTSPDIDKNLPLPQRRNALALLRRVGDAAAMPIYIRLLDEERLADLAVVVLLELRLVV